MEITPVRKMTYVLRRSKTIFYHEMRQSSERPLGLLCGPSWWYLKFGDWKQFPCNLTFYVFLSFCKDGLFRRTILCKVSILKGGYEVFGPMDKWANCKCARQKLCLLPCTGLVTWSSGLLSALSFPICRWVLQSTPFGLKSKHSYDGPIIIF
jgi:hypothetical protein